MTFTTEGELMAITDWPAAERPREKLLERGAQALSDAELLAIFLRTGITGKTAVDLARELLASFGGLRPLIDAAQTDFCQAKGLGTAKFVQLQATMEIARRHLLETLTRESALTSPALTRQYLKARLRDYRHEVFLCLFLDSQHQVLAAEELFHGSIDGASVYPREVVKRCLFHNAAAVIFAHNHPSGIAEPSDADIRITKRLTQALALIDVRVLDHVVVGETLVSLAERGLL